MPADLNDIQHPSQKPQPTSLRTRMMLVLVLFMSLLIVAALVALGFGIMQTAAQL